MKPDKLHGLIEYFATYELNKDDKYYNINGIKPINEYVVEINGLNILILDIDEEYTFSNGETITYRNLRYNDDSMQCNDMHIAIELNKLNI